MEWGCDHRLHDADLIARRVGLLSLVTGELELFERDDAFERGRLALQYENVVILDHHIAGRLVAALDPSHQGDDLDLVLAEVFQRLHGQSSGRGVGRYGHFGGVGSKVEGRVHGWGSLPVGRQEPPAEDEEDDADGGDARAHGGEVEHAEGLAYELLAHPRHDDVRRGADERDDAAEERAERHRHQEGGGRGASPAGELEGDRHEHGERADILDETRKERHATDKHDDLLMDGAEMRAETAHQPLDDARPGDGSAHHEGAAHDDDDVVAKARECLGRRHDADDDADQQGHESHEVVAPPTPGEETHHADDNAEGEHLLEGHDANPLRGWP